VTGTVITDPRISGAESDLRVSESLDRQEQETWKAVRKARIVLFKALRDWHLIESGDLPWDVPYPDALTDADGDEDAAYGLALMQAHEEAEAAREALGRAMTAHCKGKTTSTGDTA
jgi:hypothetical protein